MKTLGVVGLFLICAAISLGQKPSKGIEVKYDKFQDETQVRTDLFYPQKRAPTVWFEFWHPGPVQKEEVSEFYIYFESDCTDRYCFRSGDQLIFRINDERLLKKEADISSSGDVTRYILTRDEMQRLASATMIEYQVADLEGAIRTKDLPRIQAFLNFATTKK